MKNKIENIIFLWDIVFIIYLKAFELYNILGYVLRVQKWSEQIRRV